MLQFQTLYLLIKNFRARKFFADCLYRIHIVLCFLLGKKIWFRLIHWLLKKQNIRGNDEFSSQQDSVWLWLMLSHKQCADCCWNCDLARDRCSDLIEFLSFHFIFCWIKVVRIATVDALYLTFCLLPALPPTDLALKLAALKIRGNFFLIGSRSYKDSWTLHPHSFCQSAFLKKEIWNCHQVMLFSFKCRCKINIFDTFKMDYAIC